MRLSLSVLTTSAVLLVMSACEHAGPLEPDVPEPTIESIQQSIFDVSCAVSGCHLGASAPMGLDLAPGAAFDNLVGVDSREVPEFKRVEPGNPDDSYLVMKVEGDPRIVGVQMPLGREPLTGEQRAMIREWILSLQP